MADPPVPPSPRTGAGRQSFTNRVSSMFQHQTSSAGGSGGGGGGGAAPLPPGTVSVAAFRAAVEAAGLDKAMTSPGIVYGGSDVDATLKRFLDARKGNLDAALKMLADSIAWRHLSGADQALSRPLDPSIRALAREARPSSYIGFDDLNRPIFYERVGCINHQVLERSGLTDEQMLSYHCVEMEHMGHKVFAEATERNGGATVDKLCTIIDTAGLKVSSLTGFVQRLFRSMLSIDSDNYPESCAHIFIVNNSAVFTVLWRVVAPWVDAGTRNKVRVCGSGASMRAELAAHFRPEQLPTLVGGKLDYEAVRREWAGKIDAAMAEAAGAYEARHAGQHAPEAPTSPRLALQEQRALSRRTSSIRHGHLVGGLAAAAAVVAAADAELASGAEVGSREARRGSFGGGGGGGGGGSGAGRGPAPPPLSLAAAAGPGHGAYDDDDDGNEGWATPRSAMSRASSVMSVYYDASADEQQQQQQHQQQQARPSGRRRNGGGLCSGGDGDGEGPQPQCGCVIS